MIGGGFLASLAGSAWARSALRYGAIALAILLFLLALRRSGQHVGRLAERLETKEKANEVQRRMLEYVYAALAITPKWQHFALTFGSLLLCR